MKAFKETAEKRGFTLDEVVNRYAGSLHGTLDEIKEKLRKYWDCFCSLLNKELKELSNILKAFIRKKLSIRASMKRVEQR